MNAHKGMDRTNIIMIRARKLCFGFAGLLGLALWSLSAAGAEALRLDAVDFTTLTGNQLRLDFTLSGPAPKPPVFHTDKPARIALDLPHVSNGLGNKTIAVDTGAARSVNAVEAQGRTRVVVSLLSLVRYDIATEGNHIYLTLQGAADTATSAKSMNKDAATPVTGGGAQGQSLRNIDFMRGEKGEGRVLITLSDANAVADMRRENGKIVIYIPGASVSADLEKKLDVIDFATPVKTIETQGEKGRVKIAVTPVGESFDYSSYQTDTLLTIEFRLLTRAEQEELQKKEAQFKGERLTLNFQDIPVRQVLQILADFTNINIVASDTVQGNVTLRLNDVPWDQALDLVLKSKGLAKRQDGNVMRIGPMEEVSKQEKDELKANQEVAELEPLKMEMIPIKYAKAEDILTILKGGLSNDQKQAEKDDGAVKKDTAENAQELLSSRGAVSMDPRTNTLLVKDTAGNIDRIRQLVSQLDIAVRQVLIESRIIIATTSFTRNLGMKLTGNRIGAPSSATNTTDDGPITSAINPFGKGTAGGRAGNSLVFMNSLLDMAAAGSPQGRISATILRAGGTLLDLELSAGQAESLIETLSNPRLLTSDGHKARIKQGRQIPVQSGGSATTAPSVTYKDVVLLLEVTPHIAPDDNVMMELKITEDTVGGSVTTSSSGSGIVTEVPSINNRQIETNVQVKDGDTVVLGGVYDDNKEESADKVPFLSDIPYFGRLFRRDHKLNEKKELLVFVTPKIIRQNLAQTP